MKKYLSLCSLLLTLHLHGCKTAQPLSDDTRTAIQAQLREMNNMDQLAAKTPTGKYKAYSDEQLQAFKDSVFQAHQHILEDYFRRYGYLGYDQVGKEGSNHFWRMVQHADHDPTFQKKILRAMKKELKKKNADPKNYAYLFDRVQVNANKKQLFGTQIDYLMETTGRAIPRIGLLDSANVDQLRKEHNLEPLKDYLNMMTQLHFQMNKKNYLQRGVTKPDLY